MKKESVEQRKGVPREATVQIFHKNKNITVSAKKLSTISKFLGLMFRTRKTQNLLFAFPDDTNRAFHSFFVFFPFLMLWLDEKKNVVEWRIAKPFSTVIRAKRRFRYVLEIPLNRRNKRIIEFFVGRGKI